MSTPNAGPLAGVKVVDFTLMIAGPYTTRLLADQGAEVVKIEPPDGDPMRKRAPIRNGQSSYYGSLNAGKGNEALDLKSEDGLARARELITDADVLVENYRPGAMTKLGLGYGACRELNPRLIYCSVSGYGQSGPRAQLPAYAAILHATSGFDLTTMGYLRAEEPPPTGVFIADVMAGYVSYAAVTTALLGRERTGVGEHLDVSMYEIMLSLMVYETQAAQFPSESIGKTVYRPFRAGEEFILISAVTDRNVRALMEVMGDPALLAEPRYTDMTLREQHWEEWQGRVADWVRDQDAAEVEELLLANGVPCARYRSVDEALRDPQLEVRRSLRTAADGEGEYFFVGPPWTSTSFPPPSSAVPVAPFLQPRAAETLGR